MTDGLADASAKRQVREPRLPRWKFPHPALDTTLSFLDDFVVPVKAFSSDKHTAVGSTNRSRERRDRRRFRGPGVRPAVEGRAGGQTGGEVCGRGTSELRFDGQEGVGAAFGTGRTARRRGEARPSAQKPLPRGPPRTPGPRRSTLWVTTQRHFPARPPLCPPGPARGLPRGPLGKHLLSRRGRSWCRRGRRRIRNQQHRGTERGRRVRPRSPPPGSYPEKHRR